MSRLQDDLFQDFKEQKETIYKQLEIFEPLEARLRKPAASRLLGKGILIVFEIVCYALTGTMVAVAVLMSGTVPFQVWMEIEQVIRDNRQELADDLQAIGFLASAVCIVIAILFLIMGRMLSSIRRKNDIIHNVSKDMKALVSQHLVRKAAIQSIESRHFMDDSFKDDKTGEDRFIVEA
ncbi:MAG: hypothetical protein JNL72_15660 [Flavipsychrobacter sp.]|nr:hypothetical protein [Flavipsychrobacter sp.]